MTRRHHACACDCQRMRGMPDAGLELNGLPRARMAATLRATTNSSIVWSRHEQKRISERYVKLLREREYRLQWAERIGLAFTLPSSVGLPGPLQVVIKVV